MWSRRALVSVAFVLAFITMAAGAALAFMKEEVVGAVLTGFSTIVLILLFAAGIRAQMRWKRRHGQAFSDVGESGAPRSKQTYFPM